MVSVVLGSKVLRCSLFSSSPFGSLIPSFIRQLMNSSERISPCPVSSIRNTSIMEDLSFLRIRHTPSPTIVSFRTAIVSHTVFSSLASSLPKVEIEEMKYSQSSNPAAKLMHIFPSQVPFPLLFTVPGILAVSISSTLFRNPSGVLNPTIILGTPNKKDWIQNFISLRSNVSISRSLRISALVFSSTQFMGWVGSWGLASHTMVGVVSNIRGRAHGVSDTGTRTRTGEHGSGCLVEERRMVGRARD